MDESQNKKNFNCEISFQLKNIHTNYHQFQFAFNEKQV